VCHPDELTAFTHDFRLTACLGLLKWLVSKYEKQGGTSLKSLEGKVYCKRNATINLGISDDINTATQYDTRKKNSIST
jgi:hypothetical protein